MANEQIEAIHGASYNRCKEDAKKWRVNAASGFGLTNNYNVGDHVTITDNGYYSGEVVECFKMRPPQQELNIIGHGVVIKVDRTMLVVCWKPKENEAKNGETTITSEGVVTRRLS